MLPLPDGTAVSAFVLEGLLRGGGVGRGATTTRFSAAIRAAKRDPRGRAPPAPPVPLAGAGAVCSTGLGAEGSCGAPGACDSSDRSAMCTDPDVCSHNPARTCRQASSHSGSLHDCAPIFFIVTMVCCYKLWWRLCAGWAEKMRKILNTQHAVHHRPPSTHNAHRQPLA